MKTNPTTAEVIPLIIVDREESTCKALASIPDIISPNPPYVTKITRASIETTIMMALTFSIIVDTFQSAGSATRPRWIVVFPILTVSIRPLSATDPAVPPTVLEADESAYTDIGVKAAIPKEENEKTIVATDKRNGMIREFFIYVREKKNKRFGNGKECCSAAYGSFTRNSHNELNGIKAKIATAAIAGIPKETNHRKLLLEAFIEWWVK